MVRKRNKLYTANKWNQPLFAQGVDREHQNVFDGMFSSSLNTSISQPTLFGTNSGLNYQTPQLTKPNTSMPTNWSNLGQSMSAVGKSQSLINNFGKEATANNPLSAYKTTKASGGTSNWKWKDAAPAIGNMVGSLGNSLISGGLNSGAGSAISNIGGTVGGAISTVNPVLGGVVSAASGIIGGGVNALFGTKTDQKKLSAANQGTDYLSSFSSSASSFDDIQGPDAQANVQNAYKGGVFKKGWARKKNAELRAQRNAAESWANRSIDNNIDNIASTQMDNMLANYAAFGGPLGGAIDYGFMSDYLTTKSKAAEARNKVGGGNIFGSLQATPFSTFALGGDMQTNDNYSVGDIIEASEEQAKQLRRKGYEFRVIG